MVIDVNEWNAAQTAESKIQEIEDNVGDVAAKMYAMLHDNPDKAYTIQNLSFRSQHLLIDDSDEITEEVLQDAFERTEVLLNELVKLGFVERKLIRALPENEPYFRVKF